MATIGNRHLPGHPPLGVMSVVFGNLSLLAMVGWLWYRKSLLDSWLLLSVVGFTCGFGALITGRAARGGNDLTTVFAGMALNIFPLMLYLALRAVSGNTSW